MAENLIEYRKALRKKYTDVNPEHLSEYLPPNTVLWVNDNDDDPILEPIDISQVIPEPPPEHEIDGFGKHWKDQLFKRPKIPSRLQKLIDRVSSGVELEDDGDPTIEDIWKALEKDRQFYKEEIAWIQTQWDRILNGYWFYRAGEPIYIHGFHYAYISFFKIDNGLPEYRDRDRKFFLFYEYCFKTTDVFTEFTESKKPKKNSKGGYTMRKIGYRVCAGFNYPKHRREGATYKAACINYFHTILRKNARSGIQAMDGKTATKVFKEKLVDPWKRLPFFLKPNYSGSTDPKTILEFKGAAKRIGKRGALLQNSNDLNSSIDFATTADRNFYDSEKLQFLHVDEAGKTVEENVYDRHAVVVQCLMQGSGRVINGFTIYTSTVGETKRRGGAAFKKLVMESKWEDRTDNGMTKSKLFTLFIPAYDGLEGFIDRYGRSIIDAPSPEQMEDITGDMTIGAKEFLQNEKDAYLDAGDQEGYNKQCRLFPTKLKHCFIGDQQDSGFNIMILHNQIDFLEENQQMYNRGNFEWVNGRDHQKPFVIFKNDPNGRWVVSYLPDQHETCQMYRRDGMWFPVNRFKFTHSSDPFRFNKVSEDNKTKSDGAGASFREHDPMIDPPEKPIDKWQTNRFVCTYLERVSDKETFADDMLKQTIFYGGEHYPEMNIDVVVDYFIKHGYGGFLRYDIDPTTGKRKANPGYYLGQGDKLKNLMFALTMQHIEVHGHRERHIDLLQQWKEIGGINELNAYDLMAAAGGCFLGGYAVRNEMKMVQEQQKQDENPYYMGDIFDMY